MAARVNIEAKKPPPTWNPSQPHPERAVEEFCKDLATGLSATDSFILHFEQALDGIDASSSSVRARSHRLSRRPDVEARILAIRKARRKPVEALSEADIHRLMEEITEVLSAAHASAEEAGAPPQSLSGLRKEITRHVGRAGRMRPPAAAPFDASSLKTGLAEMLEALPLCSCPEATKTPEDPVSVAQRGEGAMIELAAYIHDDE